MIVIRILSYFELGSFHEPAGQLLIYFVYINLSLAFFNLIPVPPLDGSKILYGFLPRNQEHIYYNLERMGPILLLALIMLNALTPLKIISFWVGPMVNFAVQFLSAIFLR